MKKIYLSAMNFSVISILVFFVGFADNALAKIRAVGVSSNSKFPVTVQSVRGVGKNYVMQPFPTKVGEPLNYCDSTDSCRTYLSQYGQDLPLGWTGDINVGGYSVTPTVPTRLPLFQYSAPLKEFVGRYFEGQGNSFCGDVWYQLRSLPGIKIVSGKNRIYMNENANIVAYNLDTFFDSIKTEPLKYFFKTCQGRRSGESAYPWDAYFYPYESGWVRNSVDHGSSVIHSFDVDDRGYIYMNTWDGFGIARDTGTKIVPVMQDSSIFDYDNPENASLLTPFRSSPNGQNKLFRSPVTMAGGMYENVLSFKADGNYYVLTSEGGTKGGYNVFNVTTPLTPEFVASLATEGHFGSMAKILGTTEDIIVGQKNNSIEIYKGSEIATGGGASKTFTSETKSIPGYSTKCEGYMGLATDQVSGKIYSIGCVKEGAKYLVKISVFTPTNKANPASYTETKYNSGYELRLYDEANKFYPQSLEFNNGYLVALGSGGNTSTVKFWNLKTGIPVVLETNNFISNYYRRAPEGYASSGGYGSLSAELESYGGKTYLFVGDMGTSDVYELEPSGAGVINPNPNPNPNPNSNPNPNPNPNPDTPYTPPTPGTSCTASLSFDKTNVDYGGVVTETWEIKGADQGQTFAECGIGKTSISAGPKSAPLDNLTKTFSCRVFGEIGGKEACTSPTITITVNPVQQVKTDTLKTNSSTLRQGSNGSAVEDLQTFLNNKNGSSLTVDGVFGPRTRIALQQYQREHGLVADGVVGPLTRGKMQQ
jgi:hypothetical protein